MQLSPDKLKILLALYVSRTGKSHADLNTLHRCIWLINHRWWELAIDGLINSELVEPSIQFGQVVYVLTQKGMWWADHYLRVNEPSALEALGFEPDFIGYTYAYYHLRQIPPF